jgi:hypothetical protein
MQSDPSDKKPASTHEKFVSEVETQLNKGREHVDRMKKELERSKKLLDELTEPPKKR